MASTVWPRRRSCRMSPRASPSPRSTRTHQTLSEKPTSNHPTPTITSSPNYHPSGAHLGDPPHPRRFRAEVLQGLCLWPLGLPRGLPFGHLQDHPHPQRHGDHSDPQPRASVLHARSPLHLPRRESMHQQPEAQRHQERRHGIRHHCCRFLHGRRSRDLARSQQRDPYRCSHQEQVREFFWCPGLPQEQPLGG